MQAGAVSGPIERSAASKATPGGPITPVHDLNVPYEGTEEYETPTADLLFPPVSTSVPYTQKFTEVPNLIIEAILDVVDATTNSNSNPFTRNC